MVWFEFRIKSVSHFTLSSVFIFLFNAKDAIICIISKLKTRSLFNYLINDQQTLRIIHRKK